MTSITPIKTPEQIKKDKIFFHTPFFLAPGKSVFADRAIRFEELARGDTSDWSAYLQLLSYVCEVQQAILDSQDWDLPALSSKLILPEANGEFVPQEFQECFIKFLDQLEEKVPATVLAPLRALTQEQAQALAQACLKGELSGQDKPLGPWLHAVLQIIWTAWAQELHEDDVPMVEQRSHCPCCGTEAVASMVLISSDLANLRYMHCPLCNSRWNALCAKCTFCGEQASMALQEVEDAPAGVLKGARAETCDECRSYRKLFLLQHQQYADPLADDLASLAVDILTGEEGYQRGGANPFLLTD